MPRNIQRIKINIYIKRIVSQVGYLQGLYSACRASPVTAQRPSRGAFSHKKPPSARSLWPLFHIQFHFTIFPRGASKCQPSTSGEASNLVEIFLGTGRSSCLEILAFPFRILSFIFLQNCGLFSNIVFYILAKLRIVFEYCLLYSCKNCGLSCINSVIRCPPQMMIPWFQSGDLWGYDCLKNSVRTGSAYR